MSDSPRLDSVETPTTPSRDWTEDFSHENGRYQCRCIFCSQTFLGHKRRVVCKLCTRAPSETPEPTPDTARLRIEQIQQRFAGLRESQSKPGMNTLGRSARAAIRHNAEIELARQDVPWLLDRIALLEQQLAADRSQLRAAIQELPTYHPNYEYDSGTSMQQSPSGNGEWIELAAVLSLMEPGK